MDVKHDLVHSVIPVKSIIKTSDAYHWVFGLVRDKVTERISPVKYAGIDELWDEYFNENN